MSLQALEQTGFGATIGYDASGGGTYLLFANIMDVPTTPRIKPKKVVNSALSAAAETSQPSKQPAYGTLKFSIKFNYAMISTILGWQNSGLVLNFQITLPNGTSVYTFAGWISDFDPLGGTLQNDKIIESEIEITISGSITPSGS